MVITHERSSRKVSGSRYHSYRKKRLHQRGNLPAHTSMGKRILIAARRRGGSEKHFVLRVDVVHVLDPKKGTSSPEKITGVVENSANRHFIRRGIITKGAIIKTDKGLVKVTGRPGQVGSVMGVLQQPTT